MALGCDIIGVPLEGYGPLKVSGKDEGLKSARWAKPGRHAFPAETLQLRHHAGVGMEPGHVARF